LGQNEAKKILITQRFSYNADPGCSRNIAQFLIHISVLDKHAIHPFIEIVNIENENIEPQRYYGGSQIQINVVLSIL